MANLKIDQNSGKVVGGITDDANETIQSLRMNPVTNRALVEATISGDTGGATTLTVYNVPLSINAIEYSQQIPANTRGYKIYAVDWNKQYPHGDALKYSFKEGWSSGTAIIIPPAGYDEQKGIYLSSGTLFFQSSTGSAQIIIMAWS